MFKVISAEYKKTLSKPGLYILAVLLTATILLGTVAVPGMALNLDKDASIIHKTDDFASNYSEYLNDSVVFELPEGVGKNEEISVIVTLDEVSLMDAYENTNKTMSFAEFATSSDDATQLKSEIARQKSQLLKTLDEKAIPYKTGEEYSTVLSGFEIVIKAGDFEATCKSLGNGMDVIVGEVYETCETELVENTVNVFDTGIFDSSESGYDGSGMVVAVLDTGLDSNHTAFSPNNFTSEKLGLTYDDVAAVIDDTAASELIDGLTVDDVYINDKVPYSIFTSCSNIIIFNNISFILHCQVCQCSLSSV